MMILITTTMISIMISIRTSAQSPGAYLGDVVIPPDLLYACFVVSRITIICQIIRRV